MAELNAEQRNALAESSFAVPARRAMPIHDEEHLRAAMARFGQAMFESGEKRTAFHRIMARARMLGMDAAGFAAKWGDRLDGHQDRLDGYYSRDPRLGELPEPTRSAGATIFVGRVARTGEHVYPWGIERRDAIELRRVADQLAGKPIVVQHPAGLIADGAQAKPVGKILRGWVDGDYALAEIRVDDDGALDQIRRGLRELSLGYATDTDSSGYQRGTKVDHLAIVQRARCGSACSLRADCGCQSKSTPTLCACKNRARVDTVRQVAIANMITARIRS